MPTFDDASWHSVESLGPVESNADLFQWSADAGMYRWPGYMGMSPALRTFPLTAVATHVFMSRTKVSHLSSLTTEQAAEPFTVTNKATAQSTDADAPSLLLDFGREVAGRLLVESASPADATLSIAYGESEVKRLRPDSPLGSRAGITSV